MLSGCAGLNLRNSVLYVINKHANPYFWSLANFNLLCWYNVKRLSAGRLYIPFLKLPQSLITLHNRQLVVRHSGWLSIHFCSLTQSVSCRSTEKSDKLKYPASCNERQPLCKCSFIFILFYFFHNSHTTASATHTMSASTHHVLQPSVPDWGTAGSSLRSSLMSSSPTA